MHLSDNEIIERIRSGTSNYYGLLVDRYRDRAFTLAVRMLRSREDAEEATQDAFIRAYKALNRFEGKSRFGTWFYRILYNVCLTRIGKRKEESSRIEFEKEIDLDNALASSDFDDYEAKDMTEFIKTSIDSLPEKYQTILSLFYFQELSHEEIADVTLLPIGTIKTHLFRARSLLQQKLQKEIQFEKAV